MLRIVVITNDGSYGGNIGGPGTPMERSVRTFDIDAPELEAFLRELVGKVEAQILKHTGIEADNGYRRSLEAVQ